METTRKFTLEELGKFDGKEARLAYVAFKGNVYDVTDSSQLLEGDHLGHAAGQDLTMQMEIAPHDEEVMDRMKLIGVLSK